MKESLKSLVITISFVIGASTGYAESGVESLSPELRSLLSKEMLAIQDGMTSIFPAYISGNLNEVANIAHKIKNSYILKQSINQVQKHELKTKLPKAFLQSDQRFHQYAGMLAHVAEERNFELVGFYYSKLAESCVSCHSQYGLHKFSDFEVKTIHKDDHH